jgi:hypothetical protein
MLGWDGTAQTLWNLVMVALWGVRPDHSAEHAQGEVRGTRLGQVPGHVLRDRPRVDRRRVLPAGRASHLVHVLVATPASCAEAARGDSERLTEGRPSRILDVRTVGTPWTRQICRSAIASFPRSAPERALRFTPRRSRVRRHPECRSWDGGRHAEPALAASSGIAPIDALWRRRSSARCIGGRQRVPGSATPLASQGVPGWLDGGGWQTRWRCLGRLRDQML